MVDNKAIVKVISRITKNNGAPCKKTLQKIVFLIEAKHVDLGCDYGIHSFALFWNCTIIVLSYRTSEQAAYHLLRFFIDWSALIDASYDLRSLTKNIRIEAA